jgi:hypothetical protein
MSLLGELSLFLGLQICQRKQGIFISQTNYIREMLKRFEMEYQRQHRSMIDNLVYVTTSKLYVIQSVGHVARFQASTKESHVLAVKRILRYLKGTKEFGLWYPK